MYVTIELITSRYEYQRMAMRGVYWTQIETVAPMFESNKPHATI